MHASSCLQPPWDRAGAQPFGSEKSSEVPSSSQPAEVSSSGAEVGGAASGVEASGAAASEAQNMSRCRARHQLEASQTSRALLPCSRSAAQRAKFGCCVRTPLAGRAAQVYIYYRLAQNRYQDSAYLAVAPRPAGAHRRPDPARGDPVAASKTPKSPRGLVQI